MASADGTSVCLLHQRWGGVKVFPHLVTFSLQTPHPLFSLYHVNKCIILLNHNCGGCNCASCVKILDTRPCQEMKKWNLIYDIVIFWCHYMRQIKKHLKKSFFKRSAFQKWPSIYKGIFVKIQRKFWAFSISFFWHANNFFY